MTEHPMETTLRTALWRQFGAAIERLRLVKQTTDLHTDQLAQATLAEFLRRGYFSKHLAKMRKVYAVRLTALDEALRQPLPPRRRPADEGHAQGQRGCPA